MPRRVLRSGYGGHLLLPASRDGITIRLAMLRKRHRSERLFSDVNTIQFASVMGMVVFVLLLVFMTMPTHHHGVSVDIPKVTHPVSMPGALREDAMQVAIMRNGDVFFGTDRVNSQALPRMIADRMTDKSIERKVYIRADARTHWGTVKIALDGVRAAGILRVAFWWTTGALRFLE